MYYEDIANRVSAEKAGQFAKSNEHGSAFIILYQTSSEGVSIIVRGEKDQQAL